MISANGRYLSQGVTGVQRYAIETIEEMAKLYTRSGVALELSVLAPKYETARSGGITPRRLGIGKGQFWEQLSLPFLKRGVLINMCNTYPLLARNQIVVVHDAAVYAVPQAYSVLFRMWYKILFAVLRVRRDIRIVTVSEFSRQEISKYAKLPIDRISVVHGSANHWLKVKPDDRVLDRFELRSGGFFLGVASANPSKNLRRLLEAYSLLARADIPLVIVGGGNRAIFRSEINEDVLGVIRTGYVSDEELATLYGGAIALVFPSLYEGFGIPPLEAMNLGCPVIVSREGALPEICGSAALYCDAYQVKTITDAMKAVLNDPAVRLKLIADGYAQAAKYSWKKTGAKLLSLAEEME
jgi:glycosyltransferase involved in cell wall biosynthesis